MALESIQTHKQSLYNQVPIHSWVERVHIQVKCLPQGHSTNISLPLLHTSPTAYILDGDVRQNSWWGGVLTTRDYLILLLSLGPAIQRLSMA